MTGAGLDIRNGGTGVADTIGLFGNGPSNTHFDDIHVWGWLGLQGRHPGHRPGSERRWRQHHLDPHAGTNISRVSEATSDGDTI